ncbi:MAG TPA: trehalose-phosphatase [Longimicrobiaceae bacterium]|nr:trehalose-phosphatase [Longimicrobiaceae bacterium]
MSAGGPTHALERVEAWREAWRRSGRLVLLLDFDGTLAPIVERPEMAAIPEATRAALDRLLGAPGVVGAVVSGRGMADARERAGISGIAYAGNHGMEIEGPDVHRVHPEAQAARPQLEEVIAAVEPALAEVPGAFVEDKGLTLSIHYRLTPEDRVERVRRVVREAVEERDDLRLTEGKKVLEVRPRVEWDKGRAVLFLLGHLRPPEGAPVLYLGDDTTDEDAFRALSSWPGDGEGVLVAERPPSTTAARAYVRSPEEVGALFEALAR